MFKETTPDGERKFYVGDGCYAHIEHGDVVLETTDGIRTTNRIVLEPSVWRTLERWVGGEEHP